MPFGFPLVPFWPQSRSPTHFCSLPAFLFTSVTFWVWTNNPFGLVLVWFSFLVVNNKFGCPCDAIHWIGSESEPRRRGAAAALQRRRFRGSLWLSPEGLGATPAARPRMASDGLGWSTESSASVRFFCLGCVFFVCVLLFPLN